MRRFFFIFAFVVIGAVGLIVAYQSVRVNTVTKTKTETAFVDQVQTTTVTDATETTRQAAASVRWTELNDNAFLVYYKISKKQLFCVEDYSNGLAMSCNWEQYNKEKP